MAAIEIDVREHVGWLTLNAPERRNALSYDMYGAIPAAAEQLANTAGVRCIVLRGTGTEAFGAGSDISEFQEKRVDGKEEDFAHTEALAHAAVRSLPMPSIAMIHGHCRGGGLALALCCDLRFADTAATFAVPPAKLGLGFPVDGIDALVRVVGDAAARLLLLTAATFDAVEALRTNLVHQLAAPADLESLVAQQTTAIGRLAPLTLQALKLGLNSLGGNADRDQADAAIAACYRSEDYAEGIAAFMEKRHPRFLGK